MSDAVSNAVSNAAEHPRACNTLARVPPRKAGISSSAVAALLEEGRSRQLDIHNLLIYHRGAVGVALYKWPYRAEQPRIMHSIAKSFTAAAVGLALEEGALRLDDKVVDFFPSQLPETIDDKLTAMTVEDLLTMRTGQAAETSGVRWRGLKTSWTAEFFKIPLAHQPGAKFVYTSAASYMLSAILTKATGKTLHEYLRPRLFEPLGIEGEQWDVAPDGINPGGNGLTCKPEDLLKFGVLHLHRGMWEGKRILPADWIDSATRRRNDDGYGYHWVTGPHGEFFAMGLFGQLIAIYPSFDAVIVVNSAIQNTEACSRILVPTLQRYLPMLFPEAAIDETDGDLALDAAAAKLAAPERLHSNAAPRPELLGTHRYRLSPNLLRLTELTAQVSQSECILHLRSERAEYEIRSGIGHWIEDKTRLPGARLHHGYGMEGTPVMAGARWTSDTTLEMDWIFVASVFRDHVVLRFDAGRVTLARSVNVNSGARAWPVLEGVLIE
jgi:CubicO group peptidase (beta-lactamase class C family)